MPSNGRRCGDCTNYEPQYHECRKNAPTATNKFEAARACELAEAALIDDRGSAAAWPNVQEDDWCGEFTKPKTEHEIFTS